MSAFEFVFSLFGLLLGLSLAEVLSGLVRTVKARRRLRIGWLTPLLGVFVILHLTSFWTDAWQIRDLIPATDAALFVGVVLTGFYYFAASLVFPESPDDALDLDAYYLENKRTVLAIILAADVGTAFLADWLRGETFWSVGHALTLALAVLLTALVVYPRGKKANLVILLLLIAIAVAMAVDTAGDRSLDGRSDQAEEKDLALLREPGFAEVIPSQTASTWRGWAAYA